MIVVRLRFPACMRGPRRRLRARASRPRFILSVSRAEVLYTREHVAARFSLCMPTSMLMIHRCRVASAPSHSCQYSCSGPSPCAWAALGCVGMLHCVCCPPRLQVAVVPLSAIVWRASLGPGRISCALGAYRMSELDIRNLHQ